MTTNNKFTEFQKSLGTINFQISELIRDYIDHEQVDQERYFYRLTELDQALEMWRNALDEFAIQADDYYSLKSSEQETEQCEECQTWHTPEDIFISPGAHGSKPVCDLCLRSIQMEISANGKLS